METFVEAVCARIRRLLAEQARVLLAIDGRSAAGKTTLSARLGCTFDANVLHMDDFFLRSEQRTEARLQEPGGNVDYERCKREALLPLMRGEPFSYRPYDCRAGALLAPVHVPVRSVNIMEGAYSCHPAFGKAYDLTLFLSVAADAQFARIRLRNGEEAARRFAGVWIPLEEKYFAYCHTEAGADMVFSAGTEIPKE